MNNVWVNEQWEKLVKKLERTSVRSCEKLPYTVVNGVHNNEFPDRPDWWTNGFWGGLMWLMYAATGNDEFRKTAEKSEELLDIALFEKYDELHHDVGFMWHITAGANYSITGARKSKIRNLIAANTLAARYNLPGKFIRAWNADAVGWTIIDCMMNIPLLYWASRETGDNRYKYIAMSHADTAMAHHVRPDGSVAHIVSHDPSTGEVIETFGGQGIEEGSSWSRGQAWALYGFALSYIHTGRSEYLDTAKRVAQYFISNVCDDWLPRCDFRAPAEPVIYDSTAGMIAACGLIEIANNVPEYDQDMYMSAAVNILKAGEAKFADWSDENDSIIQFGTERYPVKAEWQSGVHIPIIYGDYYFAEAIYKLKGFSKLLW